MQLNLPIFPAGSVFVSHRLSIHCKDKIIHWIVNSLPVYQHKQDDHQSFRFAVSNFISQGLCRKIDIQHTFHVSESFVQRACNKLETEGEAGVFIKNARKGSNHAIVESVRERIQGLLDEDRSVNSIAVKHPANYLIMIIPIVLMMFFSYSCKKAEQQKQETAKSLQAVKRPNILFAISDDQSFPHASIYGDNVINTPAFDRIAKGCFLPMPFLLPWVQP